MSVIETGLNPIIKRFLHPNDLLALEFEEGWIFSRIIRAAKLQFKPWKLINASGTAVDVASDNSQAELRFRDPRNNANDILHLESKTDRGMPWILHGAIGIRPSQVRMYVHFPEGKDVLEKFPNVDPIQPTTAGNFLGYVDSKKSPYEMPTDWLELWIPPTIHISAEWYNDDPSQAHQPVHNLLFNLCYLQILKPSNIDDARLIKLIASRQIPARLATVGSATGPLEFLFEDEWGTTPIKLSEAARAGGVL